MRLEAVRILTWILGLPLAVAATVFAVANKHTVEADLWPLPITVELGLYLAVLGALALGLIVGLIMGWASTSSKRASKARTANAKVRDLEREIDQLRSQIPAPNTEAAALPSAEKQEKAS